jgi:hypothetical protein
MEENNENGIALYEEEVPNEQPVKRKRGVRNDDKYMRNMIKKARLKGDAYQTTKGKRVKAAEIGSDCK